MAIIQYIYTINRKSIKGKLPDATGFPELISLKTAAIPCFPPDDDAWEVSGLKSEAGGGGGGAGALGAGAFVEAEVTVLPVGLQTGPKG